MRGYLPSTLSQNEFKIFLTRAGEALGKQRKEERDREQREEEKEKNKGTGKEIESQVQTDDDAKLMIF